MADTHQFVGDVGELERFAMKTMTMAYCEIPGCENQVATRRALDPLKWPKLSEWSIDLCRDHAHQVDSGRIDLLPIVYNRHVGK